MHTVELDDKGTWGRGRWVGSRPVGTAAGPPRAASQSGGTATGLEAGPYQGR